jgi:hypothetical protein
MLHTVRMAFEGLGTASPQREVFLIPQWETATRAVGLFQREPPA